MALHLDLDGRRIDGIPGFYAEVNRVFMAAEDWDLAESLDALDDMLRGGYGATCGAEVVDLHWHHADRSREALGRAATRDWLGAKLLRPGFNHDLIRRQLAALDDGTGPTFFEQVLAIIADHPRIRLRM